MEEVIQAIKDYIEEATNEFSGCPDRLEEVREWSFKDEELQIWESAYIMGLERALYKLQELKRDE